MDTDSFKAIGEDLFGNAWQTRFARALGVDPSSVRRWVSGAVPVPPQIVAFLTMMSQRQEARGALIFHRQAVGGPAGIEIEVEPIQAMTKKVKFPGVDQLKPMPAIIDKPTKIILTGQAADYIVPSIHSYMLTRHPDSSHLRGYVAAAEENGHQVARFSLKHHHYTLIVHDTEDEAVLEQVIATHAGIIRRVIATTRGDDLGNRISMIAGHDDVKTQGG